MFYESEKIDKKFLCPSCSNRFDTPKSLPCGESLCETCILSCIKKASNSKNDYNPDTIICPLCDEVHMIPKKGFPTQKLLLELLNLQPTRVFRGILFDKFETGLKTLNTEVTDLKEYINESDSRIKNHCNFIREDIDIATESLIDELHKIRVKLQNYVDNFEKKSNETLTKEKKHLGFVLNDVQEKYDGYMVQLKQPELDKDLLKNLVGETNGLVGRIQKCKSDFEGIIQTGRLISFQPSRFLCKESYIGKINYQGVDGELEDVEDSEYESENEEKNDVWSDIEDNEDGDGQNKCATGI
jgi:hypothetical protein